MKNKRNILIVCTLIMVTLLSGCQLAKEDGQATERNRLVGIYITKEHLDLFDFDRCFEDHIADFANGGNVEIESSDQYGGRLYAELRERRVKSDDTGEIYSIWEHEFPSVEGIAFYMAEVTEPDGESYISSYNGGAICDGHFAYGTDATLEGTLYLAVTDALNTVYLNPVYQSNDGRVFLTAGEGHASSTYNAEGTVFSMSLEETYSTTDNGETEKESFKVTVHIAAKYPSQNITIIQMDAQSAMVVKDEYNSGNLPEQIEVDSGTAYIILETEGGSQSGNASFSRELITNTEYYITAYTARPDGIIEPRSIELIWE